MTLKLGTAKIDITPYRPVPLAGFEERTGICQGITRPLYARILVFQHDREGRKSCALLVSADLIWWDTKRARALRERIARQWDLDASAVILHATHTHGGPQTSDRFTPSLGVPDSDVVRWMEERVLDGVRCAFRDLQPVVLRRGTGQCRIGINRRRQVEGSVIMAPNPEGPVDPEVNVILCLTQNGRPKAILVHYACHPTTTGENYITSDFPGVAMERMEKQLGDGTLGVFLQGCCGNVRPALIRDQQFYRGTDKEVRELGEKLADAVFAALNRPMHPLRPIPIRSETLKVHLPFRELPTCAELEKKRGGAGVVGEWSRLLLDDPERLRSHIPLELTRLELADRLVFLAMNGEVVVEYGLMLKKHFRGRVLPLPYSNGMIGYVPTEKQMEEGGYEAVESAFYFGLPAPFSPEAGLILHETLLEWIGKEDDHDLPSTARPNGKGGSVKGAGL
ncbi:neutral/alkaline ceramidase-like enzyme [Planifilum fimeticola]|uniref:Neutral/alkaline ceramidase-like enzyme n=1 Tax=Planifilum fimeticola TaxID=201975 RepID=A0A2T0LGE2_9BACL|nr:neutral/alkaline non-lysosomal ceramidase N-terminal domain-containing protein [Planifilum fimeticola]PRX41340.1 neutral/alkaline ceramidase-like enzyme [Planifilum fimeticola]